MRVHRFGRFRVNRMMVSTGSWAIGAGNMGSAHVPLVTAAFAKAKSAMTRVATVMFLCVLGQIFAWGSVTGSISGVVKDPSGALIPGVAVTALHTETGITQVVHTNAEGVYEFLSLPVGHYEINAQQRGFRSYRETGLVLDVNTALRVDIAMALGQVSEQVSVTASSVHVDTNSTQMGEVIGSTQITAIPLNGRSYIDLLAIQPGVAPQQVRGYSLAPVSGDLSGGLLAISGQRQTNNGYMVNGADVHEVASMATAVIPTLDSIAEFRILTNNVDAEYGNYSGGQVNAVTKSGSNQIHGDAFDFVRNTSLDSRNFYAKNKKDLTGAEIAGSAIGAFHQNQFGATFGGPIKHDKAFFFGDYQGTRQVVGVSTGFILVPSAADRTGNLADVADQLTGTVAGPFWANTLSQELGYPVSAGEQYYTQGCTTSSQCVFPNAVIPQSAFSAPAQHLLQYIPLPGSGPYFTTSSNKQTLRDDKWGTRVDGNSRFGMLSAYYHFDDFNLVAPYAEARLPGFQAQNVGRAQLLVLSATKTFGGTAVNEFHLSFTRDAVLPDKPEGGVGPKLSSQGFVEGPGTLGIVPQSPAYEGVAPIYFNDYSIGTAWNATGHWENIFQAIDNFAKVIGRHSVKFGAGFHWNQDNLRLAMADSNGAFYFNGTETGFDFADFLLGAPSEYDQSNGGALDQRSPYLGLYGQDSWRVKSNITLNYGLRWDVSPFWHDTQNRLMTLVPGLQSVVFPGSPRGYDFPGDPGIPDTIAPTHYNNFAPRIGLAYSPSAQGGFLGKVLGGAGKSSVRASYGIFYSVTQDQEPFTMAADAPYGDWYTSPVPPLFATPFVDRQTGDSEGQRFPAPFPTAPTQAHPNNTYNFAPDEPIAGSPGLDITARLPYADEYSFSLQRQFGSKTLLSVSYVGTQGHRLLNMVEANPGNPALCLSVSQPSQVASGSPTCGPNGENGVYTTAAGKVINSTRSPFGADLASDGRLSTLANSNYNALEVTVRHTSGRMQILAGYTYSKSLDNSSDLDSDLVDYQNPKISKGLSVFDMTHNFVFSYSYEVPFDKLFRTTHSRLARGWRVSGVTRFSTGFPVRMVESDDRSLEGTYGTSMPDGDDVPNRTPGNLNFTNPRSGQRYFNTSLFSKEQLGQLGNSNRRFFHGPGINNFDMAMVKDLRLTESKALEFRAEFFNIFNHAQFSNPSGYINRGTFGLVTSAAAPRIGQVALKFMF